MDPLETTYSTISFEDLINENDSSHLERVAAELSRLNAMISIRGVCRSDAATIQMTDPTALNPRYPLNSYTEVPSKTNLTVTMDSVFTSIKATVKKIWDWICAQLDKLWEYMTNTYPNNDPSEVKNEAKVADEKMTEATKVAAAEPDTKKADDVISGKKPDEVAQAKHNEEQSYTNLVRLLYLDPTWGISLLAYVRHKQTLLEAASKLYSELTTHFKTVRSVKSASELTSISARLQDAVRDYEAVVKDVLGYTLTMKHSDIKFEVTESVVESVTNLFKSLQLASTTPSKTTIESDFSGGLKPVTTARVAICDFGVVVKEQTERNRALYKKIKDHQKDASRYDPTLVQRGSLYKEHKELFDAALADQKKALSMINDTQKFVEFLPELFITSIRKHIRATVRFATAALNALDQ